MEQEPTTAAEAGLRDYFKEWERSRRKVCSYYKGKYVRGVLIRHLEWKGSTLELHVRSYFEERWWSGVGTVYTPSFTRTLFEELQTYFPLLRLYDDNQICVVRNERTYLYKPPNHHKAHHHTHRARNAWRR